jgi:glycosyltransferase involved in cell wall biosynthesis
MRTNDSGFLKVLYVVHGYKPAYKLGGPILSVSKAAETLVARGHKVVVFTSNSNVDEDLDVPTDQPVLIHGVEVWYFKCYEPFKRIFPFFPYLSMSSGYFYTPSLPKVLFQRIMDFDLVHTQIPFIYATQVAGRIAIKARTPLFYQQRGVFAPEYLRFRSFKKRLYITCFERPIMRSATTLIALTDAERDIYHRLGINTHCRVVPNGIDTNQYIQEPDKDFVKSNPIHIKPEHFVILYLARIHLIKGADLMLEAFLRIADKHPNAVLLIAGPDQHGLQEQLLTKVHSSGMTNRVFFPGMVLGELKRNLLARANLFCLPSAAEGFSNSILEALTSATPVMISPECNFSAVETHESGWIIERQINNWAEKLSEILSNPRQLIVMGKNATTLIRSSYTWDKVIDNLEEVYQEGLLRTNSASIC